MSTTTAGSLLLGAEAAPQVQTLIADSKAAALDAAKALASGLDALLSDSATDAPKIEADLVPAAEGLIESFVPSPLQPFVTGIFGMATGAANPFETQLEQKTVVALTALKVRLDGLVSALEAKV